MSTILRNAVIVVALTSTAPGPNAMAQPEALLAQLEVAVLPGPASCYPGTQGQDFTIYIRGDIHRLDCSPFLAGASPCLARREFAVDGPNGAPISNEAVVILRPSVSGDGRSVYFSQFGFNGCGMNTADRLNEGCFGRDFLGFDVHSVAVSPFGDRVGLTALDPNNQFLPTNGILVTDASSLRVGLEQYRVQSLELGGNVLQMGSMDFSVNGRFILVDAFNPVTNTWAIYAVDRTTGLTQTVAPPIAGLHIRNPAFAQTSDDFMVFDVQDATTGANTVFAAGLLTGALSRITTTNGLGYPGYTGDDASIVFTDTDASTESRVSLDVQPLLQDRFTPDPARPRSLWLTDGGVGVIYRRGVFNGTLRDPTECAGGPALTDFDNDGLTDRFEQANGLNPQDPADALRDTDGDGFSNLAEAHAGTDLNNAQSSPSDAGIPTLAASVLPASRSVQVGTPATAFATIINGGTTAALGCSLVPQIPLTAEFFYQTSDPATNALTGLPNVAVNIEPGANQSFVLGLTPRAAIAPTDVTIRFDCANVPPAGIIAGVNTLLFSAEIAPVADIIALAATVSMDGVVSIPGSTGAAAFAVATVNVGIAQTITVSGDTGETQLPVTIFVCETNPMTAQCISDLASNITKSIDADETPTFSIFVSRSGEISFDPAVNRVFVRFKDAGGVTRGSTSVAVRTQ